MSELFAGLLLGAAGSLHCVAMCGPLLVALRQGSGAAGRPQARPALWQAMALHHVGRLSAYAALGAIAGLVGRGVSMAGWSRGLAIASGAALLLAAWRRARGGAIDAWMGTGARVRSSSRIASRSAFDRCSNRVRGAAAAIGRWPMAAASRAAAHAQRHPRAGRLLLGAINGLLPCGLVYAALTAAIALGSVPRAAAFMVLFGIGTTPLLAALAIFVSRLSAPASPRLRFAAPVAIALVGLLLIGRGLQSAGAHAHGGAPAAERADRADAPAAGSAHVHHH